MQINWFTFVAQIVNFLILVWLLKRFLYGPILTAMGQRENRIAARFEEAEEKQEEAENQAAAYRKKQEDLEATREEWLEDAREEARKQREALIAEARAEVARQEEQWTEALRRQRETFLQDLAQRVSRETLELARKTLRDLADADLERQVVDVFVDRLGTLDEDGRRALADAIAAEDGPIEVHTAFELDDDQRERLVRTLEATLEADVSAEFRVDADVGVGIALQAGGHRIAWSLSSYFLELQEHIGERIDAEIRSGEIESNVAPTDVDGEDASTPSAHQTETEA